MYFLLIQGLTLHKTANRPHMSYYFNEEEMERLVTLLDSATSEAETINICNTFACNNLSFHQKNNLRNGEANCVGYAQYSSAVLNYAFSYKGFSSTARPVVGQIYLYGLNIHPLMLSVLPDNLTSFFKDHDFVEIQKNEWRNSFYRHFNTGFNRQVVLTKSNPQNVMALVSSICCIRFIERKFCQDII